jgi:hypothetical protein
MGVPAHKKVASAFPQGRLKGLTFLGIIYGPMRFIYCLRWDLGPLITAE